MGFRRPIWRISDLLDVDVPAPSDAQALVFSTGRWINRGAATKYDINAVENLVSNTIAESLVYRKKIEAGDIGAGTVFRLKAHGEMLNNTGADVWFTWRAKFGGTFIVKTPTIIVGTSTWPRQWQLDLIVFAETDTSQKWAASLFHSLAGADDWQRIDTNACFVGTDSTTKDNNSGFFHNLDFTVEMNTAHADARYLFLGAVLERIVL